MLTCFHFINYIGGICKNKSSFVVNCLIAVCLSPPQSVVKRIEHMEIRYINTVIIIIITPRSSNDEKISQRERVAESNLSRRH